MSINNVIHVINFSPRKWNVPVALQRDYLITEDNKFITTEDGKKIRL
jgi:hypothetical protein